MAEDVEHQLVRMLQQINFALQLDETLTHGIEALLMVYELTIFPTWQVESGMSVFVGIMTKQRNRLLITTSGDLRLRLTNLQPKFDNLECLNINDDSIS